MLSGQVDGPVFKENMETEMIPEMRYSGPELGSSHHGRKPRRFSDLSASSGQGGKGLSWGLDAPSA